MTLPRAQPGRYFWLPIICACLVGGAGVISCSAPSTSEHTTQVTPPDPAADSVADGLIEPDTIVTDDDTLETKSRAKAPAKP